MKRTYAKLAMMPVLLAGATAAWAQCDWAVDLNLPGVDRAVYATAALDDGTGRALYVAGSFTTAGGVPAGNIAKWDGTHWSALGSGTNRPVRRLAVFDDDGPGPHPPALYAGGTFTTAGGVSANRIAKWDGASWSALGAGMDGDVLALAVFDTGGGPRLYAGGDFTTAGGVPASGFACWDGTAWSAVPGWDGYVYAATVFDNGSGPALYVGGTFTKAAGVAANYIAKWDGTTWSPLGSGMNWWVLALTVFDDDGPGPHPSALYASGWFTDAGGQRVFHVAKWDGANWSALGTGTNHTVHALTVFDDGHGPALYAGGKFTSADDDTANFLAKWDGANWSEVGGGTNNAIWGLTVLDDGRGPALYASGWFKAAGAAAAGGVAKWDGLSWSALGGGQGLERPARALTVFDEGRGAALYAAGDFVTAGDARASGVAKWDGETWSPLGGGTNGYALAWATFDDGTGPALYVGGGFETAGGVTVNGVAKWDGMSWSPLGTGMDSDVCALAVFDDDGPGPHPPNLYAAGAFTTAGGVSAQYIARWDGTAWSALSGQPNSQVWALAVFDDGSGPALYAGGVFTSIGGVGAQRIARWNGTAWSPVGTGIGQYWVTALTVFDNGAGPALYAGGEFVSAGGSPANGIVKWNGTAWSALDAGITGGDYPTVWALTVFNDGEGSALYAGGDFTTAGTVSATRIAKWNGTSWSALESGIAGGGTYPAVYALSSFGTPAGPALYAGGRSNTAGGMSAASLAKWACAWGLGDLNCDGLVNFADIDPFVLALSDQAGYEARYPNCRWLNADCNGDGAVDFGDIDPFVALLGG